MKNAIFVLATFVAMMLLFGDVRGQDCNPSQDIRDYISNTAPPLEVSDSPPVDHHFIFSPPSQPSLLHRVFSKTDGRFACKVQNLRHASFDFEGLRFFSHRGRRGATSPTLHPSISSFHLVVWLARVVPFPLSSPPTIKSRTLCLPVKGKLVSSYGGN
ncbi:hypothetical protein L1887_20609 [Cichorium endivia]|nr:hypothetical protein L1887_20609 [Cichorium endivia]